MIAADTHAADPVRSIKNTTSATEYKKLPVNDTANDVNNQRHRRCDHALRNVPARVALLDSTTCDPPSADDGDDTGAAPRDGDESCARAR